MSKGSVYLNIPRIGRVITIWYEVFFKLRVYFNVLVDRKNVLLYSIHRIETHTDVFVEVLEVHSSFSFELYIDEEFIEFW